MSAASRLDAARQAFAAGTFDQASAAARSILAAPRDLAEAAGARLVLVE